MSPEYRGRSPGLTEESPCQGLSQDGSGRGRGLSSGVVLEVPLPANRSVPSAAPSWPRPSPHTRRRRGRRRSGHLCRSLRAAAPPPCVPAHLAPGRPLFPVLAAPSCRPSPARVLGICPRPLWSAAARKVSQPGPPGLRRAGSEEKGEESGPGPFLVRGKHEAGAEASFPGHSLLVSLPL